MKKVTILTVLMSLFTIGTWAQCNLQANFQYWESNGVIAMGDSSLGTTNTTGYYWSVSGNDGSSFSGTGTGYSFTASDSVTYTICLAIVDTNLQNCADTMCYNYTYYAPVTPPCNVQASATYSIASNGDVTFTNTSGLDENFLVIPVNSNYLLDTTIANGAGFTLPLSDGDYEVYLTVYDSSNNNCMDIDTLVFTVNTASSNCSVNFTWYQLYDSTNGSWIDQVYVVPFASGNNLSYFWQFGDGATSTQQFPTHQYANVGQYALCLTITTGDSSCTQTYCDSIEVFAKSSGFTLNVIAAGSTGIEENVSMVSIDNLYPNPTDANVSLNINAIEYTTVQISVMDIAGKIVMTQQSALAIGNNTLELDTQNLTQGMYIVSVQTESGEVSNLRMIKK